ncbi:DUF5677 domain-containing protein [Streptomyces sp. V4I2]|uniref:DUF5677 domain-containing protein n=1 Tax=Streptomyces sp. V4I2 TaxID=3042280 RepID=UPI0027D8E83B|nr:DUF5677 domain-containing protein [Streptomyces sp. V4I2]
MILQAAEKVTVQGVRVPSERQTVVYPLMGWWQFTNRTAQALVSLYDQGYTIEAAPLMRNLMGHAYAMNWLADSGEPAVVALAEYWRQHKRKLARNVNETWNLPEPVTPSASDPPVFANHESEQIHKKLMGEIEKFDNMVKAYGTADVYPVYRHQSAYSHTTAATADAFLIMDEGKLKFTTEPKGGEADIIMERLWVPVALLQAAAAISPLLAGNPMKSTIDKAMRDLGLPHTLLNLQRSRPL